MSENQIDRVAISMQRHSMIGIERSDLSNELRQELFAASDWSADYDCGNKFAPPQPLEHALQHSTKLRNPNT